MKVRLIDADLLRSVEPIALRAYATSQGWDHMEDFVLDDVSLGGVYLRQDAPASELFIPNSSHFSDYAAAVARAIEALSRIEGRDELQILKDIQVAGADVLRVRAKTTDESGAIPIKRGVELFGSSHDLLLSAACAVDRKQRLYKAGSTASAVEYMQDVKFGQTEIGSFIVTLLSPVPPDLSKKTQLGLWPEFEEEPFQRKVTRVLDEAMHGMQSAVQQVNSGADIEVFEQVVVRGVSSNLCSAASKLIRSGDGLDLSLTWAQSRRTPTPRSKYVFSEDDGRILSEAARLLKDKSNRPDEDLVGFVTKLSRTEVQDSGKITLKALVDEKLMSVSVTLDNDMYATATKAHADRSTIQLNGDLQRDGQRWTLINPRDLSILHENES